MHLQILRVCNLVIILLAGLSDAFGTINGNLHNVLGEEQHAEHEKITRAALSCSMIDAVPNCFEPLSLDELAGKTDTIGAVGSPDINEVCTSNAHCDDADYFGTASYPQDRAKATSKLRECLTHLKSRYDDAINAAAYLVDAQTINTTGASIPKKGCNFVYDLECLIKLLPVGTTVSTLAALCYFSLDFSVFDCPRPNPEATAKCETIGSFGMALHGFQDFYSHSNWGDERVDFPSIENPTGLGKPTIADFLALNSIDAFSTVVPPVNLSTGCYYLLGDETPGESSCANRITHHTLNKDRGELNDKGEHHTCFSSTNPGARLVDNFFLTLE